MVAYKRYQIYTCTDLTQKLMVFWKIAEERWSLTCMRGGRKWRFNRMLIKQIFQQLHEIMKCTCISSDYFVSTVRL